MDTEIIQLPGERQDVKDFFSDLEGRHVLSIFEEIGNNLNKLGYDIDALENQFNGQSRNDVEYTHSSKYINVNDNFEGSTNEIIDSSPPPGIMMIKSVDNCNEKFSEFIQDTDNVQNEDTESGDKYNKLLDHYNRYGVGENVDDEEEEIEEEDDEYDDADDECEEDEEDYDNDDSLLENIDRRLVDGDDDEGTTSRTATNSSQYDGEEDELPDDMQGDDDYNRLLPPPTLSSSNHHQHVPGAGGTEDYMLPGMLNYEADPASYPPVDEWEDDNDIGYVVITLTEPEFYQMEEDSSQRLALSEQLRNTFSRTCDDSLVEKDLEDAEQLLSDIKLLPPIPQTSSSSSCNTTSPGGGGAGSGGGSDSYGAKYLSLWAPPVPPTYEELKAMNVIKSVDNTPTSGTYHEGFLGMMSAATKDSGSHSLDEGEDDQLHELEEEQEERKSEDQLLREQQNFRLRQQLDWSIPGQQSFTGVDGVHSYFNLKVIFEPYRTGFEETKHLKPAKGTVIGGRYRVSEILGQAAFSTALQCEDLLAKQDEPQWVCLKVIKNNKDFLDQSLDEIKLLQYINSRGDPTASHVLQMYDYFYCKEHLFIVSELLRENLYEFGKYIRDNGEAPYFTIPRLKKIAKQVLEACQYIHSLGLIHCDIKPENIVIKSYSRCEIKVIDFGSSCFVTDHLTSYIQSRSYRAPEVVLGLPYGTKIDIWSVGAVLAELHTGYVLFQNDSIATMLARISGILGPFPEAMLKDGREAAKFFTVSHMAYERTEEGFSLLYPKKTSLAARLHLPVSETTGELSEDDAEYLHFLQCLLSIDPAYRYEAGTALQHPWLQHGIV